MVAERRAEVVDHRMAAGLLTDDMSAVADEPKLVGHYLRCLFAAAVSVFRASSGAQRQSDHAARSSVEIPEEVRSHQARGTPQVCRSVMIGLIISQLDIKYSKKNNW